MELEPRPRAPGARSPEFGPPRPRPRGIAQAFRFQLSTGQSSEEDLKMASRVALGGFSRWSPGIRSL